MRRRQFLTALAAAGAAATGCTNTPGGDSAGELTVYSATGLIDWYTPQFEKFTRDTGCAVNLFEAGSGELVSRLNSRRVWEGLDGAKPVPPADLLVVLPPFIQRAAAAGLLLQDVPATTGITSDLVDPSGRYAPLLHTALCFIANPRTDPQPVTFDDLLRPDLKGRLQYSTPGESGDGTALLLLLQHLMGKPAALDYLRRLQANNVGPESSTGALQSKVDSGELLVANGDVQKNLAAIKHNGLKLKIFFPAIAGSSRTTVSMSYVAGVSAQTRRPTEAKALLAQLLSDEAQREVNIGASGIPVRDSIARQAARENGPLSVAGLLSGVTLWTPDWSAVAANLENDVAAYQAAIRKN